jgi:tRNA A-37 threonylcarbamoyl transferase component Bud32
MVFFDDIINRTDYVIFDYKTLYEVNDFYFNEITSLVRSNIIKMLVDNNAWMEIKSNEDYNKKRLSRLKELFSAEQCNVIFIKKDHIAMKAIELSSSNNVLILTDDNSISSFIEKHLQNSKDLINERITIFNLLSGSATLTKDFENYRGEFETKPKFRYFYNHPANIPNLRTVKPYEKFKVFLSKKGKLELGKMIAQGGESEIYEINRDGILFKYHSKSFINPYTEKKLKKMTEYDNFDRHLAWPIEVVKSEHNQVVGYTMPRIEGITFSQLKKTSKIDYFENSLYKAITVTLKQIFNYLNVVKNLHSINILVGDINAKNIIINKDEVFLIDCLSIQIEQYPPTANTKQYLAPEVKDNPIIKKLRSFGNESYSIFMIIKMWLDVLDKQILNNDLNEEEKGYYNQIKSEIVSIEEELPLKRLTINKYLSIIVQYIGYFEKRTAKVI